MHSIKLFFYTRFAFNALVSEEYLKAIKYFTKIKKINPKQKGIDYNLGLCYLGNKDFANSEDSLLSTLDIESCNTELYKTLGDLYYLWGKQDQALTYYCEYSKRTDPKVVGNWLNVRIALLKASNDMNKIHIANQSLEDGIICMKQKAYKKAEQALNTATTIDPSNYQAFNNFGVLILRQYNNLEKALYYFNKATDLNPSPMYRANLIRIKKQIQETIC